MPELTTADFPGQTPETWVNDKTGKKYLTCGNVINKTNKQDGERMVLYFDADDRQKVYVRNAFEFVAKFSREEK